MIYFVQSEEGGPIKIGTTECLAQRLPCLRTDCGKPDLRVLAVINGGRAEEQGLHKRFSRLRLDGEWFEPANDLMEFISKNGRLWIPTKDIQLLTCYVPERIRRALNISSARSGKPIGDIIAGLVEVGLPRDVALADESIAEGQPATKGRPGPKPRPKKD